MLRFMRGPILGVVSLLVLSSSTLVWVLPLIFVALLKLCVPIPLFRRGCTELLNDLASAWIGFNNVAIDTCLGVKWEIHGHVTLKLSAWYMVVANHQSWTDIVVLGRVFNNKIPLLKFFIKKQLMYVPLLGVAWWALDFPFMSRHKKSILAKKPHLKDADLRATLKACEKFKQTPTTIMNFLEGTRFSNEKHDRQQSPYRFLLKPRAGGMAYALQTMTGHLTKVIDVTIVYPEHRNTLWQLMSGKINRIKVYLREIDLPESLSGNYQDDRDYRVRFQAWLNSIWQEKDKILSAENG
ncbi:MAG: acyltransferase [Gammaproteobacteria bacterium]|nr:acyltransferase [Gammaproteobacteria bacterium]